MDKIKKGESLGLKPYNTELFSAREIFVINSYCVQIQKSQDDQDEESDK